MKMNSKILGILILVLIFGGILGSSILGWWQTTGSRVPQKIETGDHAGAYNPADIRGSYSFGDVSNSFDISVETLARAFAVPTEVDPTIFQVKELETIYADLGDDVEVGTDSVRLFVAYYTGLPHVPEETTVLLRPAVNILKNQADLSADQIAYLDAHIIDLTTETEMDHVPQGNPQGEPKADSDQEEVEHDEAEMKVRGQTSFAELLDWGVPTESIAAIIGGELPNRLMLVRDYCTENGLQFGQIKTELQAEIDKLK
jgi:hypothetical protein